nr:hypothetical protein [Streptomyces sp. S1D4-11]QIZ00962.1 hypothetical protein HEP87_53950 [Streptomyces sp. S1D4-11]
MKARVPTPLPHQSVTSAPPPASGIFRRAAALIADRGWCHGSGLLYIGSPHRPQAASLAGALLWAATGHAEIHDASSRRALSLLRDQLDPHGTALFDDWELLCAWNDTPARTRAQTVALLVSAHNAAASGRAAGAQPSQAAVSRTV